MYANRCEADTESCSFRTPFRQARGVATTVMCHELGYVLFSATNARKPTRLRSISTSSTSRGSYALGIDYGTSGVRGAVVKIATRSLEHLVEGIALDSPDTPDTWRYALLELVSQIPEELRVQICRVAVDGTSASLVLGDDVKMYNYAENNSICEKISAVAPKSHTASSATSSLSKFLAWGGKGPVEHQADYVTRLLRGDSNRITDWNNALKMGYDPKMEEWPAWIDKLVDMDSLMTVVRPGSVIGTASPDWGFHVDCEVCAGTTDSIAAFIACEASELGEACTSLGSSLALKLLSNRRVDDSQYGIYSHRYHLDSSDGKPVWLVGGASNVGGRTLLDLGFTSSRMKELSAAMDLSTGASETLELYPLPPGTRGERFPINDPEKEPVLDRGGLGDMAYFRSLLESIARVEAEGYSLLETLGAPYPKRVFSAGGGAYNETYEAIRRVRLGVPVTRGRSTDACVGAAILSIAQVSSTEAP